MHRVMILTGFLVSLVGVTTALATEYSAVPAGEYGVVRIITIPGEAEIFLNGEAKGLSPADSTDSWGIMLAPGDYSISAAKSGYDTVAKKVSVAVDTLQTLHLSLAPEIEMVHVQGGCFQMGSPADEAERDVDEGPQHQVCVQPFELGKYEVTFADWDACVAAEGCFLEAEDEGWGRGRRPVVNVSWEDAQSYIRWLNRSTGYNYRLPTEAEWEYAARAGTTTAFSTGDCINTDQANYDGKSEYNRCGAETGVDLGATVPVGSYAANDWSFHDMHGNAGEWVEDCWHEEGYDGAPTDGSAWLDGNCARRVIRGGSWFGYPGYLRSAYRCSASKGFNVKRLGFRLARTPGDVRGATVPSH